MPDYKQTTINGTSWQRAWRVECENPLRDTFLNRLAGIAVFTQDEAVKSECAELRTALLDITKDLAFLAAETYEVMEGALMTRYRAIASGASTEVRNVFRELES